MTDDRNTDDRERAWHPDDLGRLLLARLNAGDLDGLVALYEAEAVLVDPDGRTVVGHAGIREVFVRALALGGSFPPGDRRTTLRTDDIALTSTRLRSGETTVEVARRQPDGSWLVAIDDPDVGRFR